MPVLKKQKLNDDTDSSFYFDTINRQLLDFDFEKVCLVTLSSVNVYCCLVCGKYFQGRSMSSPAYNHALTASHHVYLNLQNEKFFILPENTEVTSPVALKSVQDIVSLLNPRYTDVHLPASSYDLNHNPYMVGYVGLNNISNNDYSNVIIQLLGHIIPIRDYYLLQNLSSSLSGSFGTLLRKLWSSHLYKSHVSPHQFLQTVSMESNGQFAFASQSPKKFLVWLLNQLHKEAKEKEKKDKLLKSPSEVKASKSPSISKSLQGNLTVRTIPLVTKQINNKTEFITDHKAATTNALKFWILTLDLPPTSLFVHESKINEVELVDLLQKYNGEKTSQTSAEQLKTYKLASTPPYLLLHIDRGLEGKDKRGNPTVVRYPEMLDLEPFLEKKSSKGTKYKLMANIKHTLIMGDDIGHTDDKNQWSISLRRDNDWISIADLEVKNREGELMFLDENYIQLWKRI